MPKRYVTYLFLVVTLVTLWFGLRPFNFMARNDVQVDTANHRALFNQTLIYGIQESRSAAYTSQPVTFHPSQGITVQLKITPLRRPEGLGHIVYLYDGQKQAAFSISQWQDHLELFSRRPLAPKGYQEVSVRDLLPLNKPLLLTITSFPAATLVFVNAQLVQTFKGFSLLENTPTTSGQLIVGNNAHGTQPWHGSIEEISLYTQTDRKAPDGLPPGPPLIRYTFDALENGTLPNKESQTCALQVPERFTPLAQNMLASFPLKELRSHWLWPDILINIFGFMPLSLCLAIMAGQGRLHPWMQFVTVTAFCFLFSLTIEAAQAFLPTRDSSLLDLLCNTLGAGLAATAFFTWKFKKQSFQFHPVPTGKD